jgi:hypothetical protein
VVGAGVGGTWGSDFESGGVGFMWEVVRRLPLFGELASIK